MSGEEVAVRLRGVGKMYKIFPSRGANLLDALGLPGRRRYREFWALRGVDFTLEKGQRLGIVGRNGAGKTTLLKLLTGNISPTEGTVDVTGEVQALIEAGAGFHPEFTGEENIRAALTLQAVNPRQMEELVREIAEFTELEEFLQQPFRTYSAGMQSRLAFATATSIRPEILIVDEILSAGDAYFASKASERMRALVESGASLLLVSHSLDHITMFCDQAIWIDRGRIVEAGRSLDVVKAYQQFTRLLDERRLIAKNRKSRDGVASHQLENYADTIIARVIVSGPDARAELRRVALVRDGVLEDEVLVGQPQDMDVSHSGFVTGAEDAWSAPIQAADGMSRALVTSGRQVVGDVAFNMYVFQPESTHRLEILCKGTGSATLELINGGTVESTVRVDLPSDWETRTLELVPEHRDVEAVGANVSLADYAPASRGRRLEAAAFPHAPADEAARPDVASAGADGAPLPAERVATHWPGEGSVRIVGATLRGAHGEQALYEHGDPLELHISCRAARSGTFDILVAVVLYRTDGIRVSTQISETVTLELAENQEVEFRMRYEQLNLGDGRYVFSVGLHRTLEHMKGTVTYDLVDRSYEFEVVGTPPLLAGLFRHSAEWSMG